MAGLIQNVMGGNTEKDILGDNKLLQATATGIDPEKRTVDANETVSGQLDKVLGEDSAVLQRARTRAAEAANSRGLLNSSMGVQAGEAAVIDAALPIAGADAATHNLAKRENQAATNAALAQNADAANKVSLQNAADANAITKIKKAGEIETGLQTLKGTQAVQLANIEAQYKQLIQSSDSASKNFQSAQQSIMAIMADPNTSESQKTAAMAKVAQVLQSSLTVTGSIANLNLAGLLTFDERVIY